MIVKNDLFDYKNRYIFQDSDFFKFSLDSILLSEYVNVKNSNSIILDMCAGNMAIPLILSTKFQNKIYGFEIQSNIFNLGKLSIEENRLSDRLHIINDDVNKLGNYFEHEYFDIMVVNPPYFKVNDKKVLNFNIEKKLARHEIALKLEDVFKLAKKFLANKGDLYIVHRAERIDEIIVLGYKYSINVKDIQFVSTKTGQNPYIVLVKCVKNSKPNIKIHCEKCIDSVKSYQNIFKEDK